MHSPSIPPYHDQAPKRVFIIDDNAMMRSMLRLGANEAEFSVVGEAGTVLAGLARCRQLEPDLVLLDLGLPDGDGLELLSELKAAIPGLCVIVVSGNNDQRTVRAAIERGAMGFILKPFSIGVVTDALLAARRKMRQHG